MQTPYPNLPAGKLAYIRRVDVTQLPPEVQDQVPEGAQVWGVHNAEGACLALTQNRDMAFVLARQNDLAPVSVH